MQHPSDSPTPVLSIKNQELVAELGRQLLAWIQLHPENLQPQFCNVDWTTKAAEAKLRGAVAARLQTASKPDQVLHWVHNVLFQRLFTSEFLDQPQDQHFCSALEHLLLPPPPPTPAPETLDSAPSVGIAALLLDAENLQLKAEEEAFLQKNCPYPIQVKLAFADWRKLGKLDQSLHSRSYDLIHVPAGKDHADGKMIAVGSSIHERYPQTRAVLICSSDSIMTSLHSQLAKDEIKVYQVTRASRGLTLVSGFSDVLSPLTLRV